MENKLNQELLNICLVESSQKFCQILSNLLDMITVFFVLLKRRNTQLEFIFHKRTELTQSPSNNLMVFYKQETSESQTGETLEPHLLNL